MNVKVLLAIAAVIAILYGLAFLLAPEFVLTTYGIPAEPSTILIARFFAVTLLALGLVVWFVRSTADQPTLHGLLIGLAVGNALGVAVSIWGTVMGTMNAMGWSAVVIYGVLLAGYLYYLFTDRTAAGHV